MRCCRLMQTLNSNGFVHLLHNYEYDRIIAYFLIFFIGFIFLPDIAGAQKVVYNSRPFGCRVGFIPPTQTT